MHHIVALSGGKDSTAMALRLRELNPDVPFTYACTPTGDELPEMVEHWLRLQDMLGSITWLTSGESLESLIMKWKAIPNHRQRWCTRQLKIKPFQQYVAAHQPATVYIGFRADEARDGAVYEGDVTRRFPMIDWGWGVTDVKNYLACRGVQVPDRTDCGACFFQTLSEWYLLWRDHPERWFRYQAWEEMTGHTFRSPHRDTHAASLAGLREEFDFGYVPPLTRMSDRKAMCSVCAHLRSIQTNAANPRITKPPRNIPDVVRATQTG